MSNDEGYYYDEPEQMFFSPEQLAMQNMLMGGGQANQYELTPELMAMLMGTAMPQMDTKGRVQPYDLGVQSQMVNFGQDVYGSTPSNLMFAAMGGPGAWAPGALDPIQEQTPFPTTAGTQLQFLAGTGGVMGTLAELMTVDGMNPYQAAARIRAMIERWQDFEGMTEQMANDLKAEIQPMTDQFGKSTPDWQSLNKMAMDIYAPYAQEQATIASNPNIQPLGDGSYVQVEERDSPGMEFLKKLGLPDPRAQYDLKYAMENDPSILGLLTNVAGNVADREGLRKTLDKKLKNIEKTRETMRANQEALRKYHAGVDTFNGANPNPVGNAAQFYDNQGRNVDPQTGRAIPPLPAGSVRPNNVQFYDDKGLNVDPETGFPIAANPPQSVSFFDNDNNLVDPATGRKGPEMPKLQGLAGIRLTDLFHPERIPEIAPERAKRDIANAMLPSMVHKKRYNKEVGKRNMAIRDDLLAYARAIAPTINAGRAGRTPMSDVIQARVNPLRAMGALPY